MFIITLTNTSALQVKNVLTIKSNLTTLQHKCCRRDESKNKMKIKYNKRI